MIPGLEAVRTAFSTANAAGSRSSILTPLQWLLGLLGGTTASCAYAKASDVIVSAFAMSTVASAIFFVAAYVYFAIRNPDALRSERFTLSKMAMERGYVGDNVSGLRRARSRRTQPAAIESGGRPLQDAQ